MTESVIRYDNFPLPKMYEAAGGFGRGVIPVTKAGVFFYTDSNGTQRAELRHPEDVFAESSLNTLCCIPLTDDHPPVMLNAENTATYQKGMTGEKWARLDDIVTITSTITNADTLKRLKRGSKCQISAGYTADVVRESGEYNGVRYDHRQTNIKYNHVSFVETGRAGSNIRARFDNAMITTHDKLEVLDMSEETEKLRYDAIESKLDAVTKDNELLKMKLEKTQAKFDSIEKAYDLAKKELTEEKAKRIDSVVQDGVRRSLKALIYGGTVLGDAMAYINHSPRDIMVASINAKLAGQRKDAIDFTNKSDEAIEESFNARFDVDDNSVKRLDCKHLVGDLYSHYDKSSATSLGEKIQRYEMSKKPAK